MPRCESVSSSDGWKIDQSGPSEWSSLHGPPGYQNDYFGRIGDKRVFMVSQTASRDPILAFYTPGSGWRRADGITEMMKGHPELRNAYGPIATVGHEAFWYTGAFSKPLRSSDGGESWTEVASFPTAEEVDWFGSDGEALYVVGSVTADGPATLWQSTDGATSWHVLRDQLIRGGAHVQPGLIAVFVATNDQLEVSTDRGNHWSVFDDTCFRHRPFFPPHYAWLQTNTATLFYGSAVFVFDPAEGCPRVHLAGPNHGEDLPVYEMAFAQGQLYGATTGEVRGGEGKVGRIGLDEATWEPISLPAGVSVVTGSRSGSIPLLFDFSTDGLGVWTRQGLYATPDGGESWSAVGHSYSRVDAISEYAGAILARTNGSYFSKAVNESDWQPSLLDWSSQGYVHPDHLIVRGERIFAIEPNTPVIREVTPDAAPADGQLVWQDESAGVALSPTHGLPADIRFHGDRVFVRSWGSIGAAASPDSEDAASLGHGATGGGVFVASSLTDEFSTFGTGLPEETASGTSSIQSMVFHDKAMWVVTALSGVWRVAEDGGRWTKAHDGLPSGETSLAAVQQLFVVDGTLYALARDSVYVRDNQTWRRMTSDAFAATVAHDHPGDGLLSLLSYNGHLIAAASNGLYAVDRDTGDFQRFWHPEDSEILVARSLPSGLYVGLQTGGVWHYGPPHE